MMKKTSLTANGQKRKKQPQKVAFFLPIGANCKVKLTILAHFDIFLQKNLCMSFFLTTFAA